MKKIYPIYERLFFIFLIILLSIVSIFLFIKYSSIMLLFFMAWVCVVFIVAALIKLFSIPSYIIISNTKVTVSDFPFLATNKFYEKKKGLIQYNGEIYINYIDKIELVTLTRDQQSKYIGYKHLFKKYLKFNLKYGNPKYIYVGNYSNRQIKKIVRFIS